MSAVLTNSNTLLDQSQILLIAEQIRHRCSQVYSKWAHPFSSVEVDVLQMNAHKTTYGTAQPSGKVKISNIYVGTDCVETLKSTLIHEYTHLIVGIKNKHNFTFQSTYEYLMNFCGVDNVAVEKGRDLLKVKSETHKPFKYHLWASLVNGEKVHVGGFFRKDKKYTNYCSQKNRLTVNNMLIVSFEYLDA